MTYLKTWEEFERASQNLYIQNPMKIRYVMKYDHSISCLKVKITDDAVCLQYKTDMLQEVKKIEKFLAKILSHMTSKDV